MRIAVILLSLTVASCGAQPEVQPEVPEPFRVPRPALAGVDEAVRDQLDRRASEVERLLAADSTTESAAAGAIGELGRSYHAYDLTTDAAACYREALRRAPSADWSYYLGFLEQVRGDLERAVDGFRLALETKPGDLVASQRLADTLAQLGRDQEAAVIYGRILEADPHAAAANRGLGTLEAAAGRPREAIRHLERALELQPEATSLHYQLSQAYRALGLEADADRHALLAGAGQISFEDPRVAALDQLAVGAGVRLARGGVALSQGRPELAIEEYRQAVAADPGNVAARTNLALLLGRAGRAAEAREHLEEALRVAPTDSTALLTLGALALSEADPGAAKQAFERVLENQPDHAGALRGHADASLALGDREAALQDLRRLVELAPDDGPGRLMLGTTLQEGGDLAAAEREFEATLALDLAPQEAAAAHLSLANLSAASGTLEAALEHYEAALAIDPGLTPAIYNRAGALSRLGRYAEAAAEYRRLLELEPELPAARFYLADALLRAGEPGLSREAFEAVLAKDPDDERARLGLAVSLNRLDRHSEALESLEASVRRLPRSGLLAHELARTLASSPDRSLRDGPRAAELASRLLAAQPSAAIAETLAMALAEAGRFEQAIEIQRRLVEEVGAAGDAAVVARLRTVLALYEGGEPCCPPS